MQIRYVALVALSLGVLVSLSYCKRNGSGLSADAADGDYAPAALQLGECLESK